MPTTKPIRYGAHGPREDTAFLTRDEALLLLAHGISVWVEGGGGCVEGQLAEVVSRILRDDPKCRQYVTAWNRGRHRRVALTYYPEEALAVAERQVGQHFGSRVTIPDPYAPEVT